MFTLPELPYGYDSLEPVLSSTTMHTHHDKHHAAYVNTLNTLLEEAGEKPESLEAVIAASSGKKFNNAAQAWNHGFFWEAMTPTYAAPTGELAKAIDEAFGDLAGLKKKFVETGVGQFGSGWAWLVVKDGKLSLTSTHDAGSPFDGATFFPITVCDVWEHAYYLDYKNDRKGFLEAWFDKLVNWEFAGQQFAAAKAGKPGWQYPAPK